MNIYPAERYSPPSQPDRWERLKQFTDARIALGRAGCSLPTRPMLEFQLAHAQARDAVYQQLDAESLQQQFNKQLQLESLWVSSQATDKEHYLKRPDLGRQLDDDSRNKLGQWKQHYPETVDVCIVVGDGLSALAIEVNALPFLKALIPLIQQQQWTLAPVIIATGSRVALGDDVAEILQAKMLVMLIGERPGLSSPDSMGMYYTWQAHRGCLDSQRNCISNIRPAGLSIAMASQRLLHLMRQSYKLGLSGTQLKDDHQLETLEHSTPTMQKRLF